MNDGNFNGTVIDNQIIFTVWVSQADQVGEKAKPLVLKALFDTGAQVTAIYDKVVQTAKLQAIGHKQIEFANGDTMKVERFRVRIDIPIKSDLASPERVVRGKDMEVVQFPNQPNDHDVLLGMDFISAFHVTMFNDQFILSN